MLPPKSLHAPLVLARLLPALFCSLFAWAAHAQDGQLLLGSETEMDSSQLPSREVLAAKLALLGRIEEVLKDGENSLIQSQLRMDSKNVTQFNQSAVTAYQHAKQDYERRIAKVLLALDPRELLQEQLALQLRSAAEPSGDDSVTGFLDQLIQQDLPKAISEGRESGVPIAPQVISDIQQQVLLVRNYYMQLTIRTQAAIASEITYLQAKVAAHSDEEWNSLTKQVTEMAINSPMILHLYYNDQLAALLTLNDLESLHKLLEQEQKGELPPLPELTPDSQNQGNGTRKRMSEGPKRSSV